MGDDFLKPGFTHCRKTKYSFSYDVTDLLKRGAGAENVLAADSSAPGFKYIVMAPNPDRRIGYGKIGSVPACCP